MKMRKLEGFSESGEGWPPYLPVAVFALNSVSGADYYFLYLCLEQEAAYRMWAENSVRHILVVLPEDGRGIGYARRRMQDVAAYLKLKTYWQVSWLQIYLFTAPPPSSGPLTDSFAARRKCFK
jgi:hypothetical protein